MSDAYRKLPFNQRAPSIYGKSEERYNNDNQFRMFVDMCRACIEDMKLTPSEAREGVMLACFQFEMRRPLEWIYDVDDPSTWRRPK